jgi:hypothetical protein
MKAGRQLKIVSWVLDFLRDLFGQAEEVWIVGRRFDLISV